MNQAARVAALLALCAGPAVAGPWTQNDKQVYIKLGESVFVSDAFRDARGRLVDGVDYLGLTSALYFELGLMDGLHLQAYLPHTIASNTFANGNTYASAGGGDLTLGLQASVPNVDLPHGLRVTIKTPLYDVTGISGREARFFPQLGDGQIDTTLWLTVGTSIPDTSLFGFIEAGHQFRSERYVGGGNGVSYNDSLAGFAQVGGAVFNDVLLLANSSLIMPYGEDEVTKGYLTLGPAIYWPIGGGYAIEANYDPILWAVNSAEGYSVSLGVSFARR